jgi:hypothetical protein
VIVEYLSLNQDCVRIETNSASGRNASGRAQKSE